MSYSISSPHGQSLHEIEGKIKKYIKKRTNFPRTWKYCSVKCEKQYAEKAMKDYIVEFLVWTRFERLNCFIDVWFCRTVLIYSISPIKSICSTFDYAPTACSFVTVTCTVDSHITIYETWKVEVNNLRFSDPEVHEFCYYE